MNEHEEFCKAADERATKAEAERDAALIQLRETRYALGEILEVTKREVNAGTHEIQMIAKKVFGDTVTEKRNDKPVERCTCVPQGGTLCGYCIRQELNRG